MGSEIRTPSSVRKTLDFTEDIRVLVGSDKQGFNVHRDIISRRSPFFKAAIAARWAKQEGGQRKKIELPEDDPHIFAAYLMCVYQTTVVLGDSEDMNDTFEELIMLYALAEKFGDFATTNIVIDRFIQYSDDKQTVPGQVAVTMAYEETPENSPLRRLMGDYWMYEASLSFFQDTADNFPPAFLHNFLKRYGQLKEVDMDESVDDAFNKELTKTMPKCAYHQHDDTHPACEGEPGIGRARAEEGKEGK